MRCDAGVHSFSHRHFHARKPVGKWKRRVAVKWQRLIKITYSILYGVVCRPVHKLAEFGIFVKKLPERMLGFWFKHEIVPINIRGYVSTMRMDEVRDYRLSPVPGQGDRASAE